MPPFVHVYCFADEPPRLCIAADEPVSVTYADTGKKVPIPTTGGIALLRDTDPIELLVAVGSVTKRVTARWPAPSPKPRRRR